jgi:DNA repair protein RadC
MPRPCVSKALEQLRVVLLDTKHRILGTRTVYQGSVNQRR